MSQKRRGVMEEKQERYRRCHGGILQATLNPNEMMCNYCGWTTIEMNLHDYVSWKGKVDNIHNVN
jgi:hypothetical protein